MLTQRLVASSVAVVGIVTCVTCVACGGSEADESIGSLDVAKQLGQLSEEEQIEMCEYVLATMDTDVALKVSCYRFGRANGANEAQCNELADWCVADGRAGEPDMKDCTDDLADCPVTVGEARRCYDAYRRAYAAAAPGSSCAAQADAFVSPSECDNMTALCPPR